MNRHSRGAIDIRTIMPRWERIELPQPVVRSILVFSRVTRERW
jgi:hypothetical protein